MMRNLLYKVFVPVIGKSGFILFCILIPGIFFRASAQKSFDVTAGIGYYELTHVGIAWNYSQKSALGLYGGTNFNREGIELTSIGLSYSHVYRKPLFWKLQPGFSLKAQYWDQDDDNYYFNNASFLFQGSMTYPFTDRLRVGLEGGGVLNFALETERKQNNTAGFPTRWNGNVCFSVRYRLIKS